MVYGIFPLICILEYAIKLHNGTKQHRSSIQCSFISYSNMNIIRVDNLVNMNKSFIVMWREEVQLMQFCVSLLLLMRSVQTQSLTNSTRLTLYNMEMSHIILIILLNTSSGQLYVNGPHIKQVYSWRKDTSIWFYRSVVSFCHE